MRNSPCNQEFQIQLAGLTVANLMETFAMAKYTGLEKPGRWAEFAYESSLRHSPVRPNGEAVSRDGSEDPNQPSSSTKSKRRLSTGSALASLARSNAKQSRKSRRRLSGRSDGYAAMTYIGCSFLPLFIYLNIRLGGE